MASSNAAKNGDKIFNSILYVGRNRSRNLLDSHLPKEGQVADRIIGLLRQRDMLIDRYVLGGRIGTRMAIEAGFKPDFYLYPFFNLDWSDTSNAAVQKALPELLDQIVKVFRFHNFPTAKINDSVRVQILEKGMPFFVDVIPAVNFFENSVKEAQWHQVLRRCANADANLEYLRSSAAEKAVEFLEKQDEFAKDVVQLAKIWNQNCVVVEHMIGRSHIVELVAVKAAQEESAVGAARSLTSALVRFFNYMESDWKNLRIVFDHVDLPEFVLKKHLSRKQESGVLIDPVNPYFNFLEDESVRGGWGHFENAAKTSLDYWENLEGGHGEFFAGRMIGIEM